MREKKYIASFVFLLVIMPIAVFAYEPRFAGSEVKYDVEDPIHEIGYYAKLPGKPARYVINFAEPGELKAVLRIPDVPWATKNVMMHVNYKDQNGESQKADLIFEEDEWNYYKDEFTGNGYFLGPEFFVEVASGTHTITISSLPDNEKPYVLIIGNREDKSWRSAYRTFVELAKIKNQVYSEMPLTAYWNIYGIILVFPVLLITVLLIYGIVKTYLNFKKMDEQMSGSDENYDSENNNVK